MRELTLNRLEQSSGHLLFFSSVKWIEKNSLNWNPVVFRVLTICYQQEVSDHIFHILLKFLGPEAWPSVGTALEIGPQHMGVFHGQRKLHCRLIFFVISIDLMSLYYVCEREHHRHVHPTGPQWNRWYQWFNSRVKFDQRGKKRKKNVTCRARPQNNAVLNSFNLGEQDSSWYFKDLI